MKIKSKILSILAISILCIEVTAAEMFLDNNIRKETVEGLVYKSDLEQKFNAAVEEKDFKNVFDKALKLAKKNDLEAQLLVSYMFEAGIGTAQNEKAAEQWRNKAAVSSHHAQGIIALMGITQDFEQEHVSYLKPLAEKAYAAKSLFGIAAMAYVHYDGYGVVQNKQLGSELLMDAMSISEDKLSFIERLYLEDIRSLELSIE